MELARLCQKAEDTFVGVRCGLLDTLTCLFGKAHTAVEIDCQSLAIDSVPMFGDHRIVVCNSGVQRELTDGGYNTLRALCDAAATALGVASLRSVEPNDLKRARKRLSLRQFECASHVVGEIRRVLFGVKALRDGDWEQFGHYMLQSHESSRDLLRNSCPELDRLVARARTHPACYGARLTGGGFGGATLNLVRGELAEDFIRHMAAPFQGMPATRTPPMLCQIAGGAEVT
jgi:galactokinase